MTPAPAGQAEAKRAFYRRAEVVAGYEQRRFGGASGAYVNARELRMVADLLPRGGLMADVGCGTGRLLPTLRARADAIVGLDASVPMLATASARQPDLLVQADAFALPLASGRCAAVTCLRVLFHFDDPTPLLRGFRRITRPGGTLVCDTSSWSPRGQLPLGRADWGERVAAIGRAEFREAAGRAGWRVRAERPCFLVSPYLYRRLPLPLAAGLERLERVLPARLLCRVVWGLEAR